MTSLTPSQNNWVHFDSANKMNLRLPGKIMSTFSLGEKKLRIDALSMLGMENKKNMDVAHQYYIAVGKDKFQYGKGNDRAGLAGEIAIRVNPMKDQNGQIQEGKYINLNLNSLAKRFRLKEETIKERERAHGGDGVRELIEERIGELEKEQEEINDIIKFVSGQKDLSKTQEKTLIKFVSRYFSSDDEWIKSDLKRYQQSKNPKILEEYFSKLWWKIPDDTQLKKIAITSTSLPTEWNETEKARMLVLKKGNTTQYLKLRNSFAYQGESSPKVIRSKKEIFIKANDLWVSVDRDSLKELLRNEGKSASDIKKMMKQPRFDWYNFEKAVIKFASRM